MFGTGKILFGIIPVGVKYDISCEVGLGPEGVGTPSARAAPFVENDLVKSG
jgi:hypothetical protein